MPRKKKSNKSNNESRNLVNLNTRVPEDLVMEVKIHCVKNRITIQDFVNEAIKARLKARKDFS